METRTIFPITRVHQPLKIDIDLEGNQIKDARSSGIMFRGFELMLEGRDPRDATYLTQRICGICSTAHGVAATFAVEEACKLEITPNAVLMRNLIFGADFVQNHLRHFYLLCLPDYIRGPKFPPFEPQDDVDRRFSTAENAKLLESYWLGTEMSRLAHQMLAIYGGKAPHQHGIIVGGSSMIPDADRNNRFRGLLKTILAFIEEHMLPDVELLAKKYNDYFKIGVGTGNFISYGAFPEKAYGNRRYPAGVYVEGKFQELDPSLITEDISHTWFSGSTNSEKPFDAKSIPDKHKAEGYTWLKAPRYDDKVMEMGPLGRLWISGDYRNGTSTMDRIVARVLETKKIVLWMLEWLDQLNLGQPTFTPFEIPDSGEGFGLTEAMRGSLGHWIKINNHKITHYQIITPTAWLFSPKDSDGRRGMVDQCLTGTKLVDQESFTPVGRIVRSFDPCFSCSGHLIEPQGSVREFRIL
ncbi:MAG TPA: nickel-dependent hydrogenase large subunit [Verrucomicrobiae bacterium]|nr:nickel-dependent hydrogenase large subunit [Verrucomicrobiae bacterium]